MCFENFKCSDIKQHLLGTLHNMANLNILSEIEKSPERSVLHENYFHEVWSNEKINPGSDTLEFNNPFSSEGEDEYRPREPLTFNNDEDAVSVLIPENDSTVTQALEDKTSKNAEIGVLVDSKIDSMGVDYFDSEDEYFETYRNKFENFQSTFFAGTPFHTANESGRYSKSLSFKNSIIIKHRCIKCRCQ